jgi:predicted RNase H-like HicB family nuclease
MYRQHFPVIIEQDKDGVYIVSCPTLRGCHSYGHTVEEAVDNITEAIEVCLEEKKQPQEMAMQFIGVRDVELTL